MLLLTVVRLRPLEPRHGYSCSCESCERCETPSTVLPDYGSIYVDEKYAASTSLTVGAFVGVAAIIGAGFVALVVSVLARN